MTRRLALAVLLVGAALSVGCDRLKATAQRAGLTLEPDFEGEITMKATRPGGPGALELVFSVKKPKYRVDLGGQRSTGHPMFNAGSSLLLDPIAKKGYALVDAQKRAMALDLATLKAGSELLGLPGKVASDPPTVDKTGKGDVVAGYACEIWNVVDASGTTELCAAEALTWLDLRDLGWASPELALAAVASGQNRFPLRLVKRGTDGAEVMRVEATRVEKKTLDPARFEVPADYQLIELGRIPGLSPAP